MTVALGPSVYNQTLHVLAGAVGVGGSYSNPPYAQGGGGSYVSVPGAFIAVAGGGGGSGLQSTDNMFNPGPYVPDVKLAGGEGGFSSATPDGGSGQDSNGSQAFGTGARGATPGVGPHPAMGLAGADGAAASVATDGTITPGAGGAYTGVGQAASDGGGGYSGGGSGAFVIQDNPDRSQTRTFGPGGGGSGFLAAGLSALATGPNQGDGYITFTYSIAAPAVPGAPTGLAATPDPDSGAAIISWIDPADTGGSAILDYPLQRSTDGTTWSPDGSLAVGIANGAYHDYGLQPGVTYYYRLAAENAVGVGPYSAPTRMVSQTYPGAIVGLTASSGDRSATLTWGAPADNAGTPVTRYEVQYASLTNNDISPAAVPDGRWVSDSTAAVTPFKLTGLSNDTEYGLRVRAVNAQGPSRDWQYTQAYPQAPKFTFSPSITQPDGSALPGGTIRPNTAVLLSQSGLPAGAKLTVTLRGGSSAGPFSATLGTAVAGSDGKISLLVTIPAGLQYGDYVLTSELTDAGAAALPYSAYFTVQAAAGPTVPGTDDESTAPSSGAITPVVAPTITAETSAPKEALALTGLSGVTWILPAAALLFLAGATLLLLARRRVTGS
ncbi:fibronectin type III domain-containing protein [Arthrobacter dokdonensis]|uniref:fibronectin type III domain-containing protein n=1 Tax=Arthrobacter dokdonellae TaxID=2211210 RepID=UPI001013CC61|nr:fibronectin type III domain-containing protein [Arthrobacter dokdonellae]